jgi:hypothetical protein
MWFHSLCGVHNGDCGMWVKWCATGLRYVGQVMFDVKGLLDAFDLHSGRRTAEMRWTDGRICKQPKQWYLLLWRFPKIRVPQIIQVIRPFSYWNPWFWSPILGPMITWVPWCYHAAVLGDLIYSRVRDSLLKMERLLFTWFSSMGKPWCFLSVPWAMVCRLEALNIAWWL